MPEAAQPVAHTAAEASHPEAVGDAALAEAVADSVAAEARTVAATAGDTVLNKECCCVLWGMPAELS